MKIISLNGQWQFKAVQKHGTLPGGPRPISRWMAAEVPGTVHTDLFANNIIPDPFYRMNELDVQWIDTKQWVYRKEFVLTERFLREDAVQLVAGGLDTYARIRVNGRTIAETANMFIGYLFDVRKYLRSGKNIIEILFDSPTMRSKALERKFGPLRAALEPHRVYVRKAQYSFSWDWGPKLTTSGIWRDIALHAFSGGRLTNPFVKMISVNRQLAVAEVSVEVERSDDGPLTLRTYIAGPAQSIEQEIPITGSKKKIIVRIPDPHLWWPNGYGEQPMYTAHFALLRNGETIHELEAPFAIRTVRLLQEKDREGRSFVVEINGEKVFCKGADWIPGDNFIPRIRDSTYETLLRLAKATHMNMIRVWGGGIYEQDIFYNLCDELGLMVWQDFMYACGEYPNDAWFIKQVKEEAEIVVKRLRNHPSIVLWCGNNECEWLFCTENPDKTPDEMKGAKIFRKILPSACSTYDGTRPYWRSSPFGTGFPNDESNGNHHQWTVWSAWKDYKEYEHDNARFVTEFGFQAPANRRTFEEITVSSDRSPQSTVMEHHNKQVEGTERLLRFQAAHYRLDNSFDGFIYQGQLVQAEALKCAVEHWRRRKFKTAGSLFWQLNDCWPVSSWAVVDSALRPKAAYYFAKKFFAPLLVSFKHVAGGVEVWASNDLLKNIEVELIVGVRSFGGRTVWKKRVRAKIISNRSGKLLRVNSSSYSGYDPAVHYLHARMFMNGHIASENRSFFVEPKHMKLPRAKVAAKVREQGEERYELTIRPDVFVKNVRIETLGHDVTLDDNYFDIDPGTTKRVTLFSNLPLPELRKKLRLKWL